MNRSESEWARVSSEKEMHGRGLSSTDTTFNHTLYLIITQLPLKPLELTHWTQLLVKACWFPSLTEKPVSVISNHWNEKREDKVLVYQTER